MRYQLGDVQRIGNDLQLAETGQLLGQRQRRSARVEKDRHALGDQLRRAGSNTRLGPRLEPTALLQGQFFAGPGQNCAAVNTPQPALFLQVLEVTADGFFGHEQQLRQVRRFDPLLLSEQAHDFVQPWLIEHRGDIPLQNKASGRLPRRIGERHVYCPNIGGRR